MKTEKLNTDMLVISDVPSLDPVTVICRDESPGRGGIIVECYGKAWSAYWGGMGDNTVKEFVATCGADYIANKLWRDGEKRTKTTEAYLLRIATAVVTGISQAIKEPAAPTPGDKELLDALESGEANMTYDSDTMRWSVWIYPGGAKRLHGEGDSPRAAIRAALQRPGRDGGGR